MKRPTVAHRLDRLLDSALSGLSGQVLAHPVAWLAAVFVVCLSSLFYASGHLGINTNTSDILSSELPFQKERKRMERLFPHDLSTIIVVVEGRTPEQADAAVKRLAQRLRAEHQAIESVYVPGEEPFFEREGLLFLEPDDLHTLTEQLAKAQPFFGRLAANNSLSELLAILGLALERSDGTLPVDLDPLLEKIGTAIEAVLNGDAYQLSWQQLMLGEDALLSPTRRFLLVKPVFDFSLMVPAEAGLDVVRAVTDQLQKSTPGLQISLTGEVAMEYDELKSIEHDMIIAGLASLALVCLCLGVGLRSLWLVLATLVVLVSGLALAAGFAALSIGHLNLISVGFAVLYIGLGVDYAIHLCLGYQERLRRHQSKKTALVEAIRSVGPSLLLCAMTTSIGFFAFIPTAYTGVSQLGLISGVSLFIGLGLTLTMLPALLLLLPYQSSQRSKPLMKLPQRVYRFPMRHRRAIVWSAVTVAIVATTLLTQVRFDFNPMNLRDPHSESVLAFKRLLADKETSPLTLTLLADNQEAALAAAARLEALESVDKVVTIMDFIPDHQQQKLEIIEDLALLLGPTQNPFPLPTLDSVPSEIQALKRFMLILNRAIESRQVTSEPMIQLSDRLQDLLETVEASPPEIKARLLNQLQSSVLGTLPTTINRLFAALDADPIDGIDDLPKTLRERWIGSEGIYRIQIFPAKDLTHIDNLKDFVREVQAVEPSVTDLPVIYLESAHAVIDAFRQALLSALVAIVVILLLTLRSLKDTLIVLVPLALASLMTGATTVLLDTPFNFANVIALPLLLGLGVDSGIHMMQRLRRAPEKGSELLQTSTARGVFFSALTTLCSFGTLGFMAHLGTASMGTLLAFGIFFTLICTLIVLPALAIGNHQSKQGKHLMRHRGHTTGPRLTERRIESS